MFPSSLAAATRRSTDALAAGGQVEVKQNLKLKKNLKNLIKKLAIRWEMVYSNDSRAI
jgi:hypothetical protein